MINFKDIQFIKGDNGEETSHLFFQNNYGLFLIKTTNGILVHILKNNGNNSWLALDISDDESDNNSTLLKSELDVEIVINKIYNL